MEEFRDMVENMQTAEETQRREMESLALPSRSLTSVTKEAATNTTPILTRLPVEVIQNIFEYCESETLKEARLVDRRWSKLIMPYLFKRITVICHLYYLERLVEDLQNSDLKDHVVCVTLDLHAAVNATWMIWDSYRWNKFTYADKDGPMKARYIQPDRNEEVQRREVEALTVIFRMLDKLDCVALDLTENNDPARPDGWSQAEQLGSLQRKLAIPDWDPYEHLQRQNLHWEKPALFESVVVALARFAGRFKELKLHDFNLLRIREGRFWTASSDETLNSLHEVLQRLDRFSINFSFADIDEEDLEVSTSDLHRADEIAEVVLHASAVTELEIICRDWMDGIDPPSLRAHHFFEPTTWHHLSQFRPNRRLVRVPGCPSLKTLYLFRVVIRSGDLGDFLAVYCPKLVYLKMRKMAFPVTSVDDVCHDHFATFLKNLKSRTHLQKLDFSLISARSEVDGSWIPSFRYASYTHPMSDQQRSESEFREEIVTWFLDKKATDDNYPVCRFALPQRYKIRLLSPETE